MIRGAIVNLLIGLTIALLPLYNRITVVDFNRTSKDNLLVLLLGALCVLMPDKKRSLHPYGWFCLFFALFLLIANQWNVIAVNVMFQTFYISAGMFFAAKFYEGYDSDFRHLILDGMSLGAFIQSVFILLSCLNFDLGIKMLQFFNPNGVLLGADHYEFGKSIGTLGNTNLSGAYLGLTALSLMRPKWIYLLPIVTIALISTSSVMGICSFVAGVAYFLNQEEFFSKAKIYILAMISMIGLFFIGAGGADSGRFESWKEILSKVDLRHFLIGMGPGWFPDQKFKIATNFLVQEHNEFISFFNIFGLAGFFLIAPIFLKFINTKDENRMFPAIVFAAFCNSYGHFTLHQSTTAIILIVAACVCMAEGYDNGRNLDWE